MTTLSQLTSHINTEAAAEYGVNGSGRFRKPILAGIAALAAQQLAPRQ
jgi:hypothetical protein